MPPEFHINAISGSKVRDKYRIFPIRTPRPNSAPVLIEPRENSVKKK